MGELVSRYRLQKSAVLSHWPTVACGACIDRSCAISDLRDFQHCMCPVQRLCTRTLGARPAVQHIG